MFEVGTFDGEGPLIADRKFALQIGIDGTCRHLRRSQGQHCSNHRGGHAFVDGNVSVKSVMCRFASRYKLHGFAVEGVHRNFRFGVLQYRFKAFAPSLGGGISMRFALERRPIM